MTQAIPEWYPHDRDPQWRTEPSDGKATAFHKTLEGYAPTRLVSMPALAAALGVGRVLAKDESSRLGLPAFKALGASWAVHRVVGRREGSEGMLVTATDGNHGRAVARYARLHGQSAHIFTPRGVSAKALAAIRSEGAELTEIDGVYDEAVAAASRFAEEHGADLVQDTAWEGYEEVPGWIVEGYSTLFAEIDAQTAELGTSADLVIVPNGVGSLLQAAITHYRQTPDGAAVVAVDPDAAACTAPSLAAGQIVTVETGITTMAGLNCGTLSKIAWPVINKGLDGVAVVSDAQSADAATQLAANGVLAGPCGAASLAGLNIIATGADREERMRHLGLGPDSTVVLLVTEGVLPEA
jgi:diaminopropionate ammonia-lyase